MFLFLRDLEAVEVSGQKRDTLCVRVLKVIKTLLREGTDWNVGNEDIETERSRAFVQGQRSGKRQL